MQRNSVLMGILEETYRILQTKFLPHIFKRHRKLFQFGFESLTLQSFVSLNSNARMVLLKRSTAETKIYRLVSNKRMLEYFPQLMKNLSIVRKTDRINVDFSSFCGFEVLTFAKQTLLGRSIPVYIAAITYPVEKPSSQTIFIIKEVKRMVGFLGFSPHFVFDRGFELPYLANYLVKNKISFTIRMKKDKHCFYEKKDIPLRNLPWFANDCMVDIYNHKLRIIVSEKKKDIKEPWYLLTNDLLSTRDEIIAGYYFRFEIEETFKDLKHVFTLKKFYKITKKQTFLVLLWFFILGIWMAFLLEDTKYFLQERVSTNNHKKLSITKYFFEQIQLAKSMPILTEANKV